MARSWAEIAYHDGIPCQAAGPDGRDEEAQARGELLGGDLGAQLGVQVLGEVIREELRVDDGDGDRTMEDTAGVTETTPACSQRSWW